MRLAGHVTGLGLTERIYSVRFMGPVGYVVTFRQTDPLYTVDLSDPAQPRVRGSVALTGYSAYLHPASDTRLIGIGRQADAMGHLGGTQSRCSTSPTWPRRPAWPRSRWPQRDRMPSSIRMPSCTGPARI